MASRLSVGCCHVVPAIAGTGLGQLDSLPFFFGSRAEGLASLFSGRGSGSFSSRNYDSAVVKVSFPELLLDGNLLGVVLLGKESHRCHQFRKLP